MEIKIVPMEKLIPADYNPRKDLKAGDIEYFNTATDNRHYRG